MTTLFTLGVAFTARAEHSVDTTDVPILGVALEVGRGELVNGDTLPLARNVPASLRTELLGTQVPGSMSLVPGPMSQVPGLFADAVVRGELSGPGVLVETGDGSRVTGVLTLEANPGERLQIPPLPVAGNYVLDNVRLVRVSGPTSQVPGQEEFILGATPSLIHIPVAEQVLVSQLTARPLSLEEIEARGIVIDPANFTVYEFTVGIATESQQVEIPLAVLFAKDEEAEKGALALPDLPPALDVPNFDIEPILLQPPEALEGLDIPPIPGVIVIPGNIAFLNQFFQVLLLVSNVAPAGSQLVITRAEGHLVLPVGDDTEPNTGDEPLAAVETAGDADGALDAVVRKLPHPDPLPGGEGNLEELAPGEEGQGEFVVEGKQTGTHRVEVTIEAKLRLATGETVDLSGKAFGTVVVRHPSLGLTFNHPDVVRAGETYALYVTVHNTGEVPAKAVHLTLHPHLVSGATLVGHTPPEPVLNLPEPDFGTTRIAAIAPNDAKTVRFDLVARKNGQVTAAAFTAEIPPTDPNAPPIAGVFQLRTGIGDRGIPLSPDTLVLPSYVDALPADFFAEALRVLGLAHSVASTPLGADVGPSTPLRTGLAHRIQKAVVERRAQDLAEAGLRLRIRSAASCVASHASCVPVEATAEELLDLWLDWLGNQTGDGSSETGAFDPGFDEILRTTDAGHDLEAALARVIDGSRETGVGSIELHEEFVAARAYRAPFLSVAASDGAMIELTDGANVTSGCLGDPRCAAEVRREVPAATLLGIGGGEWAIVGSLETGVGSLLTVTIAAPAAAGSAVRLAVPRAGGALEAYAFTLSAGASVSCTHLTPDSELPSPDCVFSTPDTRLPSPVTVTSGAPRVLGVRQIPEADPLQRGRTVAVLFDEAIDPASVRPAGFTLGYVAEEGRTPQNVVKRTKLLPRQRILLLSFASSVSRFFDYELTVSDVRDLSGDALLPHPNPLPEGEGEEGVSGSWPVVRDFVEPLGGVVSGIVRDGTGEPLAAAPVELREPFDDDVTGLPVELVTAQVTTDRDGFYRFDFVGDGATSNGRFPFRVRAFDTRTGQTGASWRAG